MINTEELLEIINDLKHVAPDLSNETIFIQACSYQRGRLAGQNKFNQSEKPISEKQKEHLKKNEKKLLKLGIKLENIKTSKQASKILNELWGK